MKTIKAQCSSCGSNILAVTKDRCNGFCMPCFMKNNYGFRPSDLESINERGLTKLAERWGELVRQGWPNIRNPLAAQKLGECLPRVYQSVSGFFLSETTEYDGDKILNLLTELKLEPDEELQFYTSKVEAYILELVRLTKS